MPDDAALRLNSRLVELVAFEHRINTPGGGWNRYAGFQETGHGPNGETGVIEFTPEDFRRDIGDVVLARRDMGTSYHLSVVLDDAEQNITHVVRGEDLFEATKIHVVLQRLLSLPTPTYHHHRLIRDAHGKRLAKRDDARAIRKYREDGASPEDIRRMVGL
jgi:glutamyl-Q tRNA(Asp) synthetase